jgi:hypothetical protein
VNTLDDFALAAFQVLLAETVRGATLPAVALPDDRIDNLLDLSFAIGKRAVAKRGEM